jgi:hypothetical protein
VAVVAVVVVAGCTQSSPRSALHSILGLQRPVLIFLSLPISLCLLEGWASQPDLKGLQGGSTLWWCEGVGTQTDAAIPGHDPQEKGADWSSCLCAPPESWLGFFAGGQQMAARPPAPLLVVPPRLNSPPLLPHLPTSGILGCLHRGASQTVPTFCKFEYQWNASERKLNITYQQFD